LASGAQPVGQALPDAAGYEPSSMATLGGAPALGQVGAGSGRQFVDRAGTGDDGVVAGWVAVQPGGVAEAAEVRVPAR